MRNVMLHVDHICIHVASLHIATDKVLRFRCCLLLRLLARRLYQRLIQLSLDELLFVLMRSYSVSWVRRLHRLFFFILHHIELFHWVDNVALEKEDHEQCVRQRSKSTSVAIHLRLQISCDACDISELCILIQKRLLRIGLPLQALWEETRRLFFEYACNFFILLHWLIVRLE